jgi:hypothetical protein
MYKVSFVFLLLAIGHLLFGQKESKLIISLTGGYANPVGDFNKDHQNEGAVAVTRYSGHSFGPPEQTTVPNRLSNALQGLNGKAEVAYLFWKNVGLSCSYYSTSNDVVAPNSSNFFPNTDNWMGGGGGEYWSSGCEKDGYWQTKSLLLGVTGQVHFLKIVYARVRASFGFQQAKSPGFRASNVKSWYQMDSLGYYSSGTTDPETFTQPRMLAKAFVSEAGIDLSIHIKYGINLTFSLDYLSSNPTFTGNMITDYEGANTSRVGQISNSYKQRISLLLVNGGITYVIKFNGKAN